MNLKGVKARVRALVGDPDADWCDDEYILPYINIAYEDVSLRCKNGSGTNLQQVLDIPNIGTAIQDLKELQAPGKQLASLTDPLFIWWKLAGQPVNTYQSALEKTTLPPVPESGAPYYSQLWWTWLSNTLFLTPMGVDIDIRLHGRFDPPALVQDSDLLQIHPNIHVPVNYATAALIGVDRGNTNWMTTYNEQANTTLDDVIADIIRQGQRSSSRFGKYNRPFECGWYWL